MEIKKRDCKDFDELSDFVITEILHVKGNKLINIQEREIKTPQLIPKTWWTVFYWSQKIIKK